MLILHNKYCLGLLAASTLLASTLLLSGNAGAEQKIYKFRDSEGSTLYSQERSGPGELEAVITVPPAPPAQARRQAQRALQQAQERADALAAQRLARQMPLERIQFAAQALEAAEIALQAGIEPRPGERLATIDGSSRLSDVYWARQRALHLSVEIARERLAQAQYEARLQ